MTYLSYIEYKNKNEDFKNLLQREFWALLDEQDYSQHCSKAVNKQIEHAIQHHDDRADMN